MINKLTLKKFFRFFRGGGGTQTGNCGLFLICEDKSFGSFQLDWGLHSLKGL